jgi:hypothetical protein
MEHKLMKFLPIMIALAIGCAAGYAVATEKQNHKGHNIGDAEMHDIPRLPTEPGQSAFAAIAEIVSILESDPNTDWSKVNLNALREHFIDMNALTLGANVAMSENEESIVFEAVGTGVTIRALQNMVPAHANELNKMANWQAMGEATEKGAVLTITPNKSTELTRIKALGFFGLMATGAHHQPHHLGMARGTMAH